MTDSEDDNETLIYDLQINQEKDIKTLRKHIDEMETVITYMERDNQAIWKLIAKLKEKKGLKNKTSISNIEPND